MRHGVTFSPNRIVEDLKKAELYLAQINTQLEATNRQLRAAQRQKTALKKLLGNQLK